MGSRNGSWEARVTQREWMRARLSYRLGMPIEILDYRETWPESLAVEAKRLQGALGSVIERIEHVGSTAVPGLGAQDTIDIQISVASFEEEHLDS